MSEPSYPDVPEVVDIALRDALSEARHPRVRELIRDAQQLRLGVLSGAIDLPTDVRGSVEFYARNDGTALVGDDCGWLESDTVRELEP